MMHLSLDVSMVLRSVVSGFQVSNGLCSGITLVLLRVEQWHKDRNNADNIVSFDDTIILSNLSSEVNTVETSLLLVDS